jgi:hypothetical protein
MRKERCKDGKKYMFVGRAGGIFGTAVIWADKIKDLRVCDLEDVANGEAMLLKADGENVVRINRTGAKWYR